MDNREGHKTEPLNPQSLPMGAMTTGDLVGSSPPDGDDVVEEDGEFFSSGNLVMLGLMAALVFWLLYKFTFEEMANIIKAALGLSFVIFVHELGHFLAAKWCDVNVTTFSIGFGPAIPGCRYKWGETTYKLAILPLGGYVQMVGQVDGDESSDSSEDDPRSYRRKSVAQRMLIISAGVIMNAILAIACFITIYQGAGKEHAAAVISMVDTASPAYAHSLRTGAEITSIGNIKNPTFTDITQTVINSMSGTSIPFSFRLPNEKEITTQIEPRLNKSDTKPVIGVAPASRLQFLPKRDGQDGPYLAGTPAAEANFHFGDTIVGMTDPYDPRQAKEYDPKIVTPLPDDPRFPNHGQCDYFEFARRLQLLSDKEIVLRVRRTVEENVHEVDVKVAPMFRIDLGARMQMGPVLVVREGSPADKNIHIPNPTTKLEGDLLESVSVTDADGKVLEWTEKDKTLDPERLPMQLRQWSDRVEKGTSKEKPFVTLQLRRHRDAAGAQFEQVQVKLAWDKSWRFDRDVAMSLNAPVAIPELGFAYQINTTVSHITQADSPLKVGDVIKNMRYEVEGSRQEISWLRNFMQEIGIVAEATTDLPVKWMEEDLTTGQWANISFEVFQQPYHFKKMVLKVEREKKIEEVEMPLIVDTTWALENRGWRLAKDARRVKASDPLHAVWMGLSDTTNRMVEVFQNLRGMILGRIGIKNLGGPLTIAVGTYRFAGMDFTDFVWFLGLISINLAVVNFLPIPVLDGGHMVFLIYEKLRGKPASEGVRIAATYVGLAMIGCLMIFVLYLDVSRLFL